MSAWSQCHMTVINNWANVCRLRILFMKIKVIFTFGGKKKRNKIIKKFNLKVKNLLSDFFYGYLSWINSNEQIIYVVTSALLYSCKSTEASFRSRKAYIMNKFTRKIGTKKLIVNLTPIKLWLFKFMSLSFCWMDFTCEWIVYQWMSFDVSEINFSQW